MRLNQHMRVEALLLAIAAALNVASWLWLALRIPSSVFPVIVHYNVFWGRDLLGEWPMIFTAPLLGATIFLANAVLVSNLKDPRHAFLRYSVAAATVLLQLSVLAIAWFVISVNI